MAYGGIELGRRKMEREVEMGAIRRIELAGSIAAGKSTFCDFMARNGFRIIGERIAENPYLAKTYAEPSRRGFYVQSGFLLSKGAALEEKSDDPRPVVSDYALIVEYAYAAMHLSETDPDGCALAVKCIDFMRARIGAPDLLVYLKCSPEAQMARIRERMKNDPGRDFEKSLTVDYLDRLGRAIDSQVGKYRAEGGPVLELDGDRLDFRVEAQARQVARLIVARLALTPPAGLNSRAAPSSGPSL